MNDNKLTIEQKAQRYDEAIEVIKNLVGAGLVYEDAAIQMFPELQESGDEKIRKELIEQVVYIVPNNDEVDSEGNVLPTYQKRIDKYLAWLEKQGGKDEEILILKGQIESLHAAIKAIKETHRIELEKQGEHAKFCDSIQVGDKVTRNEDGVLVNLSQLNRVAKKDEKQIKKNLQDNSFRRMFERKPAEWSEEDEAMYEGVIETEQYMLDVVYGRKIFAVGNEDIKKDCAKELAWFKSLKDRCTWKPSKEQLKELENVFSPDTDSWNEDILRELYKQLKQL